MAEDDLRLQQRGGLPAPPSGTTSRVGGHNMRSGGIAASRGPRGNQELTAAQKRERRAFLENVLVNEPYRLVDAGDPSTPTRTTPTSNACAICLEEYQKGDRITKSFNSRCNHVFHRHCALQWFLSLQGNDDTCPCCRQNFLQFDDVDDNDGHNHYSNSFSIGENRDSTAAVVVISPSASFAADSRVATATAETTTTSPTPPVSLELAQPIQAAFSAQHHHMPPPLEQPFASPPQQQQQRRVVDEAVYLQALHDLVDEETSVVATTNTTTTTTTPTTAAQPVAAAVSARQVAGHNYSHGPVATAEGVSISGLDTNKSTLFEDEAHQHNDLTSLPGRGSEWGTR